MRRLAGAAFALVFGCLPLARAAAQDFPSRPLTMVVALLPSNPMLIDSKLAVPAKSLKELIGWINANAAGNVRAGTAGVGSESHIAGVYFEKFTGAHLQFVPYRGTGPALLDNESAAPPPNPA